MPEASIDPVVMAASTALRLQTIVSREGGANEAAVVTIGVLQAGTKENVIPDEAIIKLNVRTFDEGVRKRVYSLERIVNAEAAASGAPRNRRLPPWTAILSLPMIRRLQNVFGAAGLGSLPMLERAKSSRSHVGTIAASCLANAGNKNPNNVAKRKYDDECGRLEPSPVWTMIWRVSWPATSER